ncbi:hypothetical protein OH720_13830 [Pseudomonas sp. WJP1]|uniref:hypothetical protein n=1 Tax=Pseudomonas sp. WJP1 TaxID=2986947 RepID=UPI00234BA21A|nr:hypothetical protein [Pseudomonas sp. WJP1]WCM54034.1 hypothetical protein OH720_13830 [Pseudomonas sp. WJP1]
MNRGEDRPSARSPKRMHQPSVALGLWIIKRLEKVVLRSRALSGIEDYQPR